MSFPFFQIPLLPLKKCLSNMVLSELISLALCSRRSKKAVKLVGKSWEYMYQCSIVHSQYHLLEISDPDLRTWTILFVSSEYEEEMHSKYTNIGGELALIRKQRGAIPFEIDCEDPLKCSLKVAKMLMRCFRFSFREVSIEDDRDIEVTIEWVRKHANMIQNFIFRKSHIVQEELCYILNSLRNAQDLSIELNKGTLYKFHITKRTDKSELIIEKCFVDITEILWKLNYHSIRIPNCLWLGNHLKKWATTEKLSPEIENFVVEIPGMTDLSKALGSVPNIMSKEEWVHPSYGPIDGCVYIERVDHSKRARLCEVLLQNRKRLFVMLITNFE